MEIYQNKFTKKFTDKETGLDYPTKTGLKAKIKRFKYDIPFSPFLSNRYINNNINIER
jgi:hypothetical protein